MARPVVLLVLLGLIAASPLAHGHPHGYILSNDARVATAGCPASFPPSIGYVCFAAGEIQPDGTGAATLSIDDELVSPVSGFYCQDLDDDSLCGEAPFPPDGTRLEPNLDFCGWTTITTPIDVTPRPSWDSNNWDPLFDVYVFLDGPVHGNPATSPCRTPSSATLGSVTHEEDPGGIGGCVPTRADPATYDMITLGKARYYISSDTNADGLRKIYQETNGIEDPDSGSLQRGASSPSGDPDTIVDEDCGQGPDMRFQ